MVARIPLSAERVRERSANKLFYRAKRADFFCWGRSWFRWGWSWLSVFEGAKPGRRETAQRRSQPVRCSQCQTNGCHHGRRGRN